MKLFNHLDLFLARFDLLTNSRTTFKDQFSNVWRSLRFNPNSSIAEKSVGELYLSTSFNNILKEKSIQTVFDVGANVGQFRERVRNLGFQGMIYSFEPVRELYQRTISIDDISWKRFNFALGSKAGTTEIKIYKDHTYSSLLDVKKQKDGTSYHQHATTIKKKERVDIVTFDSWIKEEEAPLERSCLKIDTQGFDMEVLLGAEEALEQIDVLLLEVSNHSIYVNGSTTSKLLPFVFEKGYKIRAISPISFSDRRYLESFDLLLEKI